MMLSILCNFAATQTLPAAARLTNPFARRLGSALLLVITLLLPPIVYAQSPAEITNAESSAELEIADTAPVVVNGEVSFRVVGISAYPAERRAAEIAGRIEALAKEPSFDPGALLAEDVGDYHQILPGAGRKPILRVLEADAEFEGVLRSVLAETIKTSIAASIKDYRHDHKPAVLIKNALYALAGALLLVALLYGLFWSFRRLGEFRHRLQTFTDQLASNSACRISKRDLRKSLRASRSGTACRALWACCGH